MTRSVFTGTYWKQPRDERTRAVERNWLDKHPLRAIIKHARCRAKDRGIAFTITEKDFPIETIPSHCPVLGIKFGNNRHPDERDSWMSLDRVDNDKGYTKDNVIIVSYLANRMKNNGTIIQMKMIVDFYERIVR